MKTLPKYCLLYTSKSISDEKVKSALKVIDAVFVNQQNIDDLVKAAGYNNQKELFENVWKQTITDVAKEYNFTPNEEFTFQETTYKMNVYGAMSFKVNTNACLLYTSRCV